jgi:hypothetical protein
MAPPRKKRRAAGEGHPLHLRLPSDVMKLVETKAKKEQWPLNRAVINLLASIPLLEKIRDFDEVLGDLKVWNARQSARVTWLDLSEELLNAVDAVLKTQGSARDAAIDQLRVTRTAMLKSKFIEQAAKE